MKDIITFAVVCCGTLAAATVGAQGSHPSQSQSSSASESRPAVRPPSRWWSTERYIQELRLTPAQSAEIEKIVQSSMARLKDDKTDLDRAQSEFRALMERAAVNERELVKAAERLEFAKFAVSKERTTMLVRIHNVLSPEQRKGLNAISKRNDSDLNRPR